MNKEMSEQLAATAERLAGAAEALNRVLDRLDAQQEALNAKVDRIVAAVEEQNADANKDADEALQGKLRARVAELEEQLATRKVVERAKGVLMRRHGLSEEEAYLRLQRASRNSRRPLRAVAEAVLAGADPESPGP